MIRASRGLVLCIETGSVPASLEGAFGFLQVAVTNKHLDGLELSLSVIAFHVFAQSAKNLKRLLCAYLAPFSRRIPYKVPTRLGKRGAQAYPPHFALNQAQVQFVALYPYRVDHPHSSSRKKGPEPL